MNHRQSTSPPRGIVLFSVLAILAVAMIVLATVLRGLVDEHAQSRLRHEQRQCRRLAEAGLARGQRLLAQDPNYRGETWTIAADELPLPRAAAVSIDVADGAISATATYPADTTPHVRCTRRADTARTTAQEQLPPFIPLPLAGRV